MITVRLSDILVRFAFRLVVRPLFRIRVLGSEHIPSCGPALLVSNHLTYLGDAEMHLKHPELARPLLENALRIDAGQELAHLDLGIVYADTGRNDDALKELKEAERLNPEVVSVHWRLGRLYRTMGKKDEAKAEFERASSINKTTDTSLVDKVNGGHANDKPGQQSATVPTKK